MEFHYTITREMLKSLVEIAALEARLAALALPPVLRTSLLEQAKVRTSHFSNQIEGNCLTLQQTEDVWRHKRINAPSRDIQEVKNLFELFDFMIETAARQQPLTSRMICTIHRMVERNIVKGKLLGHYREAQNAVFDSETGRIVYLPPQKAEIPALIKQLIARLNGSQWEHELIRAAVAHFGLVTIHPFMDGNGRTARALSTLLLMQAGFHFVRYMAWDQYFAQHRSRYYGILHAAQGDNFYDREQRWDLQEWIQFFISGVEESIRHFLDRIGAYQGQPLLNRRQEKALRYLQRNGRITNREYRQLNKVSNYTALLDLQSLETQGVTERVGKGRASQYLLKK